MLQNKKFIIVLAMSIALVAFYNISFFMKKRQVSQVYTDLQTESEGMAQMPEGYSDITTEPEVMAEQDEEYGDVQMEPAGPIEEAASDKVSKLAGQAGSLKQITLPSGASFERKVVLLQDKEERNPFLTEKEHHQALTRGRDRSGKTEHSPPDRGGQGASNPVTGKKIKMIYIVNDIGHVVVGGSTYKVGDSVDGEVILAIMEKSLLLSSGKSVREIFIGSRESMHGGKDKK